MSEKFDKQVPGSVEVKSTHQHFFKREKHTFVGTDGTPNSVIDVMKKIVEVCRNDIESGILPVISDDLIRDSPVCFNIRMAVGESNAAPISMSSHAAVLPFHPQFAHRWSGKKNFRVTNCSSCLEERLCAYCEKCPIPSKAGAYCYRCYARYLNTQPNFVPINCPICKSPVKLDDDTGIKRFHCNTVSGDNALYAANNLKKIFVTNNEPRLWTNAEALLYQKCADRFWDTQLKVIGGKKEICDVSFYGTYTPAMLNLNTGAGFYVGIDRNNVLKSDIYTNLMVTTSMKIIDACKLPLAKAIPRMRSILSECGKLTEKIESKVAEEPPNLPGKPKLTARTFSQGSTETAATQCAMFSSFAKVHGIGYHDDRRDIALGLKYFHGSALFYFMELYNVTAARIRSVKSKEQILELENEILADWVVLVMDLSGWDGHQLLMVLVDGMAPFIKLWNIKGLKWVDGHAEFNWDLLNLQERAFILVWLRTLEILGFKTMQKPDGSGWIMLVGTLQSGVWLTSLSNSVTNCIQELFILSLMFPEIDVIGMWEKGLIRMKKNGDDSVVVIWRHLLKAHGYDPSFGKESQDLYTNLWLSKLNHTIKAGNIRVCDSIFIHDKTLAKGNPLEHAPDFLKYFVIPRLCSEHGLEMAFWRPPELLVAKLNVSATRTLTPKKQMQRIVCCCYSGGVDINVYMELRKAYAICIDLYNNSNKDLQVTDDAIEDEIDDYVASHMKRYGLTKEEISFFPDRKVLLTKLFCQKVNENVLAADYRSYDDLKNMEGVRIDQLDQRRISEFNF
jgi:hypothetical protein